MKAKAHDCPVPGGGFSRHNGGPWIRVGGAVTLPDGRTGSIVCAPGHRGGTTVNVGLDEGREDFAWTCAEAADLTIDPRDTALAEMRTTSPQPKDGT
jgi:hypothetical protein